jgi:hypothetical protein
MIGMVGFGQDITARLLQDKEYFKLMDTANTPIFVVDTNSTVNIWNKCAIFWPGTAPRKQWGRYW